MTHQRERIYAHIDAHAGLHFNELTRQLDLAPGQVQYHTRKLERQERIVAESLFGQTHYYPPAFTAWERKTLALFRRETARDVLIYLLEHGPERPGAVADALTIARSTLEWHLDNLVEAEIVEKRRDERGRVTLALCRPEETARLLGKITPSLPDSLVDRFVRLVDSLLAE
ncbi:MULTISPECIES: winged helix-turn-helix transcriptional regulator [unclassified Haladaptatus]|uniref:winged helix-turn-helix transcriptional regulator n=1 Tax=unclassified Haladaptatus TaxID=2622732 RepID=UPI0023E8F763|nr:MULTISPECIES: winged helix-turn-helix transcriptional regulator [unclassified Haladaptatus]